MRFRYTYSINLHLCNLQKEDTYSWYSLLMGFSFFQKDNICQHTYWMTVRLKYINFKNVGLLFTVTWTFCSSKASFKNTQEKITWSLQGVSLDSGPVVLLRYNVLFCCWAVWGTCTLSCFPNGSNAFVCTYLHEIKVYL